MLAASIDDFVTACRARNLSAKTLEAYSRNLEKFKCFALGENLLALADVQPAHLRAFLAGLLAGHPLVGFAKFPASRPYSPYSVHQVYRVLKTFFNWCESERLLKDNPMRSIQAPKCPKRIVPRLDQEQVDGLLDALAGTQRPVRNLALVALMVDSGLRVGELVGIRVGDLDLDHGRLIVTGKGDKQREVPLSAFSCEAIRKYFKWRSFTNYRKRRGFHSSEFVFLAQDGQPLTGRAVYEMLAKVRQRLGWKRLYPHLLRHTFAKLYLRKGDLKTLQVILGHADISTTATFYLDPDFADLQERHREASPLAGRQLAGEYSR